MRDPKRQHDERERKQIPEFVSLHHHFALLVRFLIEFVPCPDDLDKTDWDQNASQEYWVGAQNSLLLAASMNRIDLHFGVIDDSFVWCSPAYDYDQAKDELVSRYVLEVTRFMWAWVTLEHIIDKLSPGDANSRQRRAIALMKKDPLGVLSCCDRLTRVLADVSSLETHRSAVSKAKHWSVPNRIHYFMCKEIRNSLFHSPTRDIEPSDWGAGESLDFENDDRVVQFRVAARLVLLISQELLITYLRRSPAKTDIDEDAENLEVARNGILSGCELWRALKCLHFIDPVCAASDYDHHQQQSLNFSPELPT